MRFTRVRIWYNIWEIRILISQKRENEQSKWVSERVRSTYDSLFLLHQRDDGRNLGYENKVWDDQREKLREVICDKDYWLVTGNQSVPSVIIIVSSNHSSNHSHSQSHSISCQSYSVTQSFSHSTQLHQSLLIIPSLTPHKHEASSKYHYQQHLQIYS